MVNHEIGFDSESSDNTDYYLDENASKRNAKAKRKVDYQFIGVAVLVFMVSFSIAYSSFVHYSIRRMERNEQNIIDMYYNISKFSIQPFNEFLEQQNSEIEYFSKYKNLTENIEIYTKLFDRLSMSVAVLNDLIPGLRLDVENLKTKQKHISKSADSLNYSININKAELASIGSTTLSLEMRLSVLELGKRESKNTTSLDSASLQAAISKALDDAVNNSRTMFKKSEQKFTEALSKFQILDEVQKKDRDKINLIESKMNNLFSNIKPGN